LSVEVNALGDLGEAATSWRELAQRSRNPFATWEWARTWWSHFGAGEDLRLFSCRPSAGDPVAILPLSRSRLGPLRALRVIGHGPSDQLTPVCADADRELALAGLAEAIGSMDDWDLFLGERIPESWPIEEALATRPLGKESNPALLIGGRSWDDILAERSKGFRGQVRRYERRLVRELGLRFRLTSSPDRLGEDMDLLFALHSARWGPGTTRFPALAAFHRDFAAVALEQGWLRLWVAEVADRPAAAWYGFRYAGVESFYQTGRDPNLERWSLGFVLLNHTIREAVQDGMDEYRFLRGGESYQGPLHRRRPHAADGCPRPHAAGPACRGLGGRSGRPAPRASPHRQARALAKLAAQRTQRTRSSGMQLALERPTPSASQSGPAVAVFSSMILVEPDWSITYMP